MSMCVRECVCMCGGSALASHHLSQPYPVFFFFFYVGERCFINFMQNTMCHVASSNNGSTPTRLSPPHLWAFQLLFKHREKR